MTDKEFIAYVNDKKREGMADNQIARNLGMSLTHFIGKLNGTEKKAEPVEEKKPVAEVKTEAKAEVKKPDIKPKKQEEKKPYETMGFRNSFAANDTDE